MDGHTNATAGAWASGPSDDELVTKLRQRAAAEGYKVDDLIDPDAGLAFGGPNGQSQELQRRIREAHARRTPGAHTNDTTS